MTRGLWTRETVALLLLAAYLPLMLFWLWFGGAGALARVARPRHRADLLGGRGPGLAARGLVALLPVAATAQTGLRSARTV